MSRKLDSLVQEALARIIKTEIADPRLSLVTITDVDVSPDAAYATVYYSALDPDLVSRDPRETGGDPLPQPEEVAEGFASAASRIRSVLGQRLSIRRTPELRFEPDPVAEQASRVESLLRTMRADGGEGI